MLLLLKVLASRKIKSKRIEPFESALNANLCHGNYMGTFCINFHNI
jgi:hypothetical protein